MAWALTLTLPDTAYQGDLIIGRVTPNAPVLLNGQPVPVGPQGYFVIPVPRDQKKDLPVTAMHAGQKQSHLIRVWKYPWQVQYIEGLPARYVTPDAQAQRQIREDAQKVRSVRDSAAYPLPLFVNKGFIKPVAGRVTGHFGNQRILNGHPRSPHSGIDIAAPLGKSVRSPADGIARLCAENMFLMGNTLMMDHGLGVYSIFVHLQSIQVQEGDFIRQGEVIARVGKSGRATGPHLHWGVSASSVPIDPLRLIRNRANPSDP